VTAATTTAAPPAPGGHSIVVRGQRIPVVLPSRRDPRMHLSVVVMTLQVLGQTVLDFKVSIAQIAVTLGFCALVELAVTFRREARLVWPASALLTGNGVAFILRTTGTEHGDWWSLNGIHYFLLAALLALLSKYLIRHGGRHLFNPANVGLVWCLLVIGPSQVFPQYLWWGPSILGQALAYAVIAVGAWWILRKVRMLEMAGAFLATFAVLIGLFALAGNSFFAIWQQGPISGFSYWVNIALAPELLIFVCFMMSDPQTAPKARSGRIVYGAATAGVAAALTSFQTTEFGIKLAILSSLTVVCALVPLIESAIRRRQARPELPPTVAVTQALPSRRQIVSAARNPILVAAAVIAIAAPLNTAALAGNEQVLLIERGLAGKNAQ
jgi:Na+-transporting NADH:ubiquinone oxidoreductase subunit NqrB